MVYGLWSMVYGVEKKIVNVLWKENNKARRKRGERAAVVDCCCYTEGKDEVI